MKAVLPRAHPPIESFQEIMQSKITQRLSGTRARTALYADGCKSWKKAAAKFDVPCYQVSHTSREYCKVLSQAKEVPRGCSSLAGTQSLGAAWGSLKHFVSRRANRAARDKRGYKTASSFIKRRVQQWVFRQSVTGDSPQCLLKAVLGVVKVQTA